MEDGAIRLAAADGCDALAALYAQSSQRLVVLDIAIDTTKRPDQLRLQAKALRDVESESTAFGIAEMVDSGMARDERIYKSWERNGP